MERNGLRHGPYCFGGGAVGGGGGGGGGGDRHPNLRPESDHRCSMFLLSNKPKFGRRKFGGAKHMGL